MVVDNAYCASYKGKSTDTKPNAKEGDEFYEYDTQELYVYNGTTWIKQ